MVMDPLCGTGLPSVLGAAKEHRRRELIALLQAVVAMVISLASIYFISTANPATSMSSSMLIAAVSLTVFRASLTLFFAEKLEDSRAFVM